MRPTVQGVAALLASLLFAGVAVVGVLAAVDLWRNGNLGTILPQVAPTASPVPAINITRTAVPSELPIGGGHIDYTFLVTNPGNVVLASVTVTDLRCPDVTFVGGDSNSNARLDPDETWRYTCSGRLSDTTTDSATATAAYGSVLIRDSEQTTVPVGYNRPALHLESSASPSELPAGGGTATFSYVVTNVGNVAIASVSVIDSACAPIAYGSGDANENARLDLSETWRFSCATTVSKTTTGNARVLGFVNGSGLHDDTTETVTVAGGHPSISLAAAASPTQLPAGGGSVTYTFSVTNTGNVALTDVAVATTACAGATLSGGDTNADGRLDLTETWRFGCSAVVSTTISTAATASGRSGSATVTATASTSVDVAGFSANAPAVAISVSAQPAGLPAGGGTVVYTYTVSNRGDVPLSDVSVTDDGCPTIRRTGGDTNANAMLDPPETWLFSCVTGVFVTTTNQATVTGTSGGRAVTASASASVVVAAATASPTPTPRPTPTPTPTPTASPTPSPTASPSPSPTQTPTPSPTRSPVATAEPARPTLTPSAAPTASITDHGSVAGVTSPPRASPSPGQTGSVPGPGGSIPSVPALILIGLIGAAATALILRLGNRPAVR